MLIEIKVREQEDDLYLFDVIVNNSTTITVVAYIKIEAETLYMSKVDIGGAGALVLGGLFVRKIVKHFGIYFMTKFVVLEGGKRTTGRQKGKIPTTIKVKV
jgi:hypothetical protein